MASPDPASPASATPATLVLRLGLVALVCAVGIGLSKGGAHLREVHVYTPTCTPICAKAGARYDGTTQHRKIDSAAACVCVSPGRDRLVVPTAFFSSIGVVDALAAFFTSTMGVFLGAGVVALGVYAAVRRLRGQAA